LPYDEIGLGKSVHLFAKEVNCGAEQSEEASSGIDNTCKYAEELRDYDICLACGW